MKTKYYRYTLKGEHSVDDAQRAIGEPATQGLIVRIDNFGGETQVYIASQAASAVKSSAAGAKKAAGGSGIKVEEVSEKAVTQIARK